MCECEGRGQLVLALRVCGFIACTNSTTCESGKGRPRAYTPYMFGKGTILSVSVCDTTYMFGKAVCVCVWERETEYSLIVRVCVGKLFSYFTNVCVCERESE